MKIYLYYTRAYQILIDEWFLPSARKEYEVILKQGGNSKPVDYKKSSWISIMGDKVDFIIEAIRDSWNETFIFSDPDVQFIGETKKDISIFIKGKDLVFQKDSPQESGICAGFFVCKGSNKTLRFWQDVRNAMEGDNNEDDQDCAINLLFGKKTQGYLKKSRLLQLLAAKFSKCGLNPWRIKWGYLPVRFFGGGTLTGKLWSPGMDLPIPRDIVMHHANYTVGLKNKITQLRYVKETKHKNKNKNNQGAQYCLNLGCGGRFHPQWTNIDFVSKDKRVISHDLNQGIPFAEGLFDVVYCSHLLEHFPKDKAGGFLKECYRVLKPGGILRVVVPDLEQIARDYIKALERALSGSQEWADNYEWILLEMYDQAVRNKSCGEMATYLSKENIPNKEFIFKRMGKEARDLIENGVRIRQVHKPAAPENRFKRLAKRIKALLFNATYRKESLIKLIFNKEYNALQIGRFRQAGEIHQQMYDRYSLNFLMRSNGFENVVQRTATESFIPDWTKFNLDTEPDGSAWKPASLYMEGIKPAQKKN